MEEKKESRVGEILEKDPMPNVHGVLLSDAIKYFIEKHGLIENYDLNECLQPASYDLRLGEQCAVGGKRKVLGEKDPFLEIPPHQVAIVTTYEKINMPRFLIGRWSSRIKWTYQGLVWAGGPQVDPGYQGPLICPLYNLSDKPVTLKHKQRIVSIDFVKTTPFTKKQCKEYPRPRSIEEYNWDLASAPAYLVSRVDRFEEELREFRESIQTFRNATFVVLSIIIAAISLISAAPFLRQEIPYALPVFIIIGVLVIVALILTIYTSSHNKVGEWFKKWLN